MLTTLVILELSTICYWRWKPEVVNNILLFL